MRYKFLRFPEGKEKAVTFSYDDGVVSDLRLAEIFDKYNMKGTFNLPSTWISEEAAEGRLSKKDIEDKILGKGHEVAIHGAFHLAPGHVRTIDGIREFLQCRIDLENMFDRIIRGMAYPNSGITSMEDGQTYERIREYLTDMDIVYSRSLGGDNDGFRLPNDWLDWVPTAHHNNEKIFEYINKFLKIDTNSLYVNSRYPRLFYVWGHSYEFDNNDNWDRIESICEKLGGREDTWYATNMEIYEYVTAYRGLSFSADASRVYNPSIMSVWIYVEGDKTYKINPGETIKIKN